MEAFRQARTTCHTTLAPSVARADEEHVLRVFNAPTKRSEKDESTRSSSANRRAGLVKRQDISLLNFRPLRFIHRLTSEALTDAEAEKLVHPIHAHITPFESLLDVLVEKLLSSVSKVSWNEPQERPEWESDLRFYGPWWIVVRSTATAGSPAQAPPSILEHRGSDASTSVSDVGTGVDAAPEDLMKRLHEGKPENQYPPLLVSRGVVAENRLLADLALRLGGATFKLGVFHLSGIYVSPDRMHVLIFDGFRRLCTSEYFRAMTTGSSLSAAGEETTLSTLSFSCCQMRTATLLVLLAGVAYLGTHHLCYVHTLDLSYNELTKSSLWCLAQMLRFAHVRRLSLRGNPLTSSDAAPLRDLLLDGCDRELEELDLSYTALSPAQANALIDCLPLMSRLRVLLLEEVEIPQSKWPAFARAVEKMNLWHVRLFSGAPSSIMASYARAIEEICESNHQKAMYGSRDSCLGGAGSNFFGMNNSSFFEAFFALSRLRGVNAGGQTATALPSGYGVFTTNDPSLRPRA